MTRGYTISRIILTVLMSFCIAGYILSSSADALLSLPGIYTDIIREEKLAEKAYTALENDFKNQYNTTAVPPEVYMEAISEEWLRESMCISIENNINVLNGDDETAEIDFTALEENITAFFYEYAESINYEPDKAFEEKLSETITNAETKIQQRMDAFYLNTLKENGALDKISRYIPLISILNWVTFGASMALTFLLVFLERNRNFRRLYWSGTGFFCGSALTAIPMIYLLISGAANRFAVKDPVIYTAVTELLDSGISRILFKSAFFGIIGIVLIVLNVIFNKTKSKE